MKHLTFLLLGVTTLALSSQASAATAPRPLTLGAPTALQTDEAKLANDVDGILAEYEAELAAFSEALNAIEDEEAKSQLFNTMYPNPEEYATRLRVAIDEDPSHEAVATAILWVMRNAEAEDHGKRFFAILLEHHAQSKQLADICSALSRSAATAPERFLRKIIKLNPSRKASGCAMLALADLLKMRLDLREIILTPDDGQLSYFMSTFGSETVQLCRDLDPKVVQAELKKLLMTVCDDYGDVSRRGRTLGLAAGGKLFEIERLQVGMVAPDITGPDLDGVEFKLSDYRGKVVFLDFWGDW